MQQILVVDDDIELCELVAEYLEPEGYKVEAVHQGPEGVTRSLSGDHALVVLDYMLPGLNGFEVLRQIRAHSSLPVVMLTARGDDVNRIVGLQMGADDYLPKPFNPMELVARINAVLRRTQAEPDQQPVLEVVRARLLTPVGLRSLAPDDPNYKAKYFGDLRSRDAAYHQGTVWAWLIGPFIDAWLKVHPKDFAGARKFLAAFENHLDEACLGSISEIFDAEAPFTPRGCIAQAWSVAEVLRCLEKTAVEQE